MFSFQPISPKQDGNLSKASALFSEFRFLEVSNVLKDSGTTMWTTQMLIDLLILSRCENNTYVFFKSSQIDIAIKSYLALLLRLHNYCKPDIVIKFVSEPVDDSSILLYETVRLMESGHINNELFKECRNEPSKVNLFYALNSSLVLRSEVNLQEASALAQSFEEKPSSLSYLYVLAERRLGNYNDAMNLALKCRECRPHDGLLAMQCARLALNLGRRDIATEACYQTIDNLHFSGLIVGSALNVLIKVNPLKVPGQLKYLFHPIDDTIILLIKSRK